MIRTYKVWLFGLFGDCKLVKIKAKDITDCHKQIIEKYLSNRYFKYKVDVTL